jgi:hypothetical protein
MQLKVPASTVIFCFPMIFTPSAYVVSPKKFFNGIISFFFLDDISTVRIK